MKLKQIFKIVLSISLSVAMIIQPVTGINTVNAGEVIAENDSEVQIIEELVEDDEVAEVDVTDDELSEDIEEIDAASYSMPGGYVLTEDEISEKIDLSEHAAEYDSLTAGTDYVAGEYVVLADTEEEARTIATAYHAELAKYDTGVATLKFEDKSNDEMNKILSISASLENNLPAIWPNGISYICEGVDKEENSENKILDVNEEIIEVNRAAANVSDYNDPYLNATSSRYQWFHSKVGSYDAWKLGYTGAGVKVAVLDSGVLNGHEDLPVVTAIGCHEEDLTGKSEPHGTNVAGLIGASLNNGVGGAGVAPDVKLYSGCVLPGGTGDDAAIMAGINKAVDAGVDIINMSLGGPSYNAAYNTVITNAYNKGVAVFVSAGNDGGKNYSYPGAYDKAIAVAATNSNDERSNFSNYGNNVKISAPGVNMWSTSSTEKNAYVEMSGTSQAAPVASGTAAVILGGDSTISKMKKGPEKVDALVKKMQDNVIKTKTSNGMGAGITSLSKVFKVAELSETPTAPDITFEISGDHIYVNIVAQKGNAIYYRTDGKNPTYKNGMIDSDNKTYRFNAAVPIHVDSKEKCVKAIAVNSAGVVSPVKAVTFNLKPSASSVTVKGITNIAKGKSGQLSAYVYPVSSYNNKVTWSIYTESGDKPLTANEQAYYGVSVSSTGKVSVANNATTGSKFRVVATAMDSDVNGYIYISVIEKVKISSVKFTKNTVSMATGKTSDSGIDALYSDNTKAPASEFTWSSANPDIADVNEAGVIEAHNPGKTVITAIANDSSGKKASLTVNVIQLASSINIKAEHTVMAGKSIQLIADVLPSNTSDKKIDWSISNANGLKISANGKVTTTVNTPDGEYEVTATAKDGSGVKATCKVKVIRGGITKLDLADKNNKNVDLFRVAGSANAPVAKNIYLNIEGANKDSIEVVSSNPGVAGATYISSGSKPYVNIGATGTTTGKCVITVRSTDGTNKSAKINVKVVNPASGMTIAMPTNNSRTLIAFGKSVKLTAAFESRYGKTEKIPVEWSIKEALHNGISVNKSGTVKVTSAAGEYQKYTVVARAMDGSGIYTEYEVETVRPATYMYIINNGRKCNPGMTFYGLKPGYSYTLIVRNDSPYAGLYFSESDPNVISANSEYKNNTIYLYIYANHPGKSTITLSTTEGGKSVKYSFIVDK